jgi:exonuclease III
MKFAKITVFLMCLIFVSGLHSQNFEELSFGTDTTFEVMTWNIEWFPKNGQTTVNNVKQIIEALDVDIIALQEIDDKTVFHNMINDLPGWDGFFIDDEWSSLAYIYRSEEVEVLDIFEIYTTDWREFPRSPLVIELLHKGEKYILINNHLKCCGDGIMNLNNPDDEETRRYDASNMLEDYISSNYPWDRVILLGDLNDILTDLPENNVFKAFTDDPDNYMFADMGIATGDTAGWSYPWWPSHIDHILISNELFSDFWDTRTEVKTIELDEYYPGGMYEYDDKVSDHRPVAIRFPVADNFGINNLRVEDEQIQIYPNPVSGELTLSLDPTLQKVEIEIYNLQGQLVESFLSSPGKSEIRWNTRHLPDGVYFARFYVAKQEITVRKLILKR